MNIRIWRSPDSNLYHATAETTAGVTELRCDGSLPVVIAALRAHLDALVPVPRGAHHA